MLSNKAFEGLTKSSPEKRYKSFLNIVADLEYVWLLSSKKGYATLEVDGFMHLLVWPRKEFCIFLTTEEEKPAKMEIHEFLKECAKLDSSTRFMVFPTEINTYIVTTEQLCADIREHLEEVE